MLSEILSSVVGNLASALFFLAGLYVYVSLVRQIAARTSPSPDAPARPFGLPEALVAAVLISLLVMNVAAATTASSPVKLNSRFLVADILLTGAIVLVIAAILKFRGFDLESLGGLSRISVVRAIGIAAILLLAAFPLISLADAITQKFLGSGSSKQNIIELFNSSRTLDQRIMIIVLAVAVAPVAEEFIFRFFLYGVLKRYFGRFFGLVSNSLLFAAAHTHLPSFAPLFVLGACFTIAYEWSGSILVSMAMHSLFNSLSLVFLAFPELFQQ
jgi:membrane protease YdiL (CAAX protease family)